MSLLRTGLRPLRVLESKVGGGDGITIPWRGSPRGGTRPRRLLASGPSPSFALPSQPTFWGHAESLTGELSQSQVQSSLTSLSISRKRRDFPSVPIGLQRDLRFGKLSQNDSKAGLLWSPGGLCGWWDLLPYSTAACSD